MQKRYAALQRSAYVLLVTVSIGLLALTPAMAQQAPVRLLFAKEDEAGCSIRYWFDGAAEAVEIARADACPQSLFIDRYRRHVFVVDESEIRVIRIKPAFEVERIALPEADYRVWVDQMTQRPDENPNYEPGHTRMNPVGVRYLDDGALGVAMSLWMPADDAYHYLFRYEDDGWSLVASKWCGRWGCEDPASTSEPFHSQNYRSTRDSRTWPEKRMIWHLALLQNRYVTSRKDIKYSSPAGHYTGKFVEVEFQFEDSKSLVTAFVSASEHSDTLHTFAVNLAVDSGEPTNLSENQSLTSIVGRHILVQEFFGGRFTVTDISSGETVFDDLATAAWID